MGKRIISYNWFPWQGTRGPGRASGLAAKFGIGLIAGLFVFLLGHRALGAVIWIISTGIFLASLLSKGMRDSIDRSLASFGHAVGRLVGYLLLSPVHIVIFPIRRALKGKQGNDPLLLRGERNTYWVESEKDSRKLKHIGAMFAPDLKPGGGVSIVRLATVLIVFLLVAEVGLRLYGFGSPILYKMDPTVGYYPAPNQSVMRYGGRVEINNFGMRSPDIKLSKKAGDLRILMLGDSTLYGGSYMEQDELYARRLEHSLNSEQNPGKVEVLSVGVNAWGPYHKLGYIKKFGTFGAGLAIIAMPIGDIFRPMYGLRHLPFWPSDRPPRLAIEEMAWHFLWRYRSEVLRPSLSPEEIELMRKKGFEAYLELGRELRTQGIEVVFEILPSRSTALGKPVESELVLTRAFTETLEKEGFRTGFPTDLFKGKGDADKIYRDGYHLYRTGHEVYAEYLRNRVTGESPAYRRWVAAGGGPG